MNETLTVRVGRLENLATKAKWVLSIVGTCLVAFGGFTWFGIPERARLAVHDEAVRQARVAIFQSQREARQSAERASEDADAISAIRQSLGQTIFDVSTVTASVRESRTGSKQTEDIADKDVCFLSVVDTDGGAEKACSLSKTASGWLLTATQRRSTVKCTALCFNFESKAAEEETAASSPSPTEDHQRPG